MRISFAKERKVNDRWQLTNILHQRWSREQIAWRHAELKGWVVDRVIAQLTMNRSDIESVTVSFAVLMSTKPASDLRLICSGTFRVTNMIQRKSTSAGSKPLLFMHEPGMDLTHSHRPFRRTLTKGSKLLIELTEQTDISTGNDRKHVHDTDKSKQSHETTSTVCLQES